MRRLLTLIFALATLCAPVAVLPAQSPTPQRREQTKEQTVYITKTGKKYHLTVAGTCLTAGFRSL